MRISLAIAVLATASLGCPSKPTPDTNPAKSAASQPAAAPASQPASAPASSDASGLIKRGADFTVADETALAMVIGEPTKFVDETVKVRGKVQRACTKKGCWMELRLDGVEQGVRVRFKDYGFFVPTDSAGCDAVVEGQIVVSTLAEADAKHLEGEGAKIQRNDKGEAVEIGLVATAVELKR